MAGLDSLPLSELIKVVNRHSQNLHAELVLRLLGREKGPRDLPNDQAGIAVVLQFLSRNSLLAPGIVIQDGSGLSRLDRSTAAVLQGLAVQMSTHRDAIYFYDSLPEGGEDGTLHRRLSGVMVRAKSGSLATSKSLTGYLTTAAGRRVAFSFVYNGPPGTSAAISQIDTMIEAIARADSP
ncbi:MAG TPA: D-alanyl-D-alanine carboxypeptidase [Blastocatellia bacterium]|nr:D-alanyl-D-alanine carboxypeptidase [Blastocatellia bacterium]